MAQPKRVAVIGFDCAMLGLLEKHIAEGHLPTFKKLIEGGAVAENCLPPFPTITPPNWATIATGAWAGTHQVTDFHVHLPNTTPDNTNMVEAFNSERVKAETLWDAADKAGKKCIVLNYPGSWPSKMKHGIVVGGAGLTVGEQRDGRRGLDSDVSLCASQLITTGSYPMSNRVKFQEADGWMNVPDMGDEELEAAVRLKFPRAMQKPSETIWHLLARKTGGDAYDQITLAPAKDLGQAFCTLAVGQWSDKIQTPIKMPDGSEREVAFRCKLLELSDDGEEFRLYMTAFIETSGWSSPADAANQIVSPQGIPEHNGGLLAHSLGWLDLETYVELNEMHDLWLGDAATCLLTKNDWDLFVMHSHPIDWMYHVVLTSMDPAANRSAEEQRQAWDVHRRIYQSQDRMLARILATLGKDTLVVLVSDHGATPDGPTFDPYKPLMKAELTAMRQDAAPDVKYVRKMLEVVSQVPDPAKCKAFPQRSIYVYVNLKGRDPEGIVEPEDYEKVQQEIIEALLAYVDPSTGRRPVALALPKRDARILGLYGDGVGDVVYAVYPSFGSQHGQQLPTAEWGLGCLKALLVLNGPGIRAGLRLQRNVWLTDVVPTICYALDLPVPEQAEGAVIYQAFKDPNFKLKQITKLGEALARMETALSRDARQPWDKHDCA